VIVLFPGHKTRYKLCIVYAGDDPIVPVHANALLTGTAAIVIADLRESGAILAHRKPPSLEETCD
jgi:hypothetical protein